jgi:hypothetical protein
VAVPVEVEAGVALRVGVKVSVGVAEGGMGLAAASSEAAAIGEGSGKAIAGWQADSSSATTAITATGDRLDFVFIEDRLLEKMGFRVSRTGVPTGLGRVVRKLNYRQQ